jgi:hypothetical protein
MKETLGEYFLRLGNRGATVTGFDHKQSIFLLKTFILAAQLGTESAAL